MGEREHSHCRSSALHTVGSPAVGAFGHACVCTWVWRSVGLRSVGLRSVGLAFTSKK